MGTCSKGIAAAAAAVLACGIMGASGCTTETVDGATGTQDAAGTAEATRAQVPTGQITVLAREDGSGTRASFTQAFGLTARDQGGSEYDSTTLEAAVVNTTSAVMAAVAEDPNAIGYISLGSLDQTVKAVAIDGVMPSVETVRDGTYPASRPLGVVSEGDLSDVARDFLDFVLASDGQAIIENNGYVPEYDGAAAYEPGGLAGKVVVAGSSSVVPVMEKLAEAYGALNPDVRVEVHLSDSSTGVTMAVDMVCDLGMVSRGLHADEAAQGAEMTVVARDGIAVVVNPASSVDELTKAQVKAIFDGTDATWEDVL